jgi:VIT1/CCC1 family predicted Fe2+/Mn2+ transporter
MVEKELGLVIDEGRSALQGAFVMGASFGLAALAPLLPYVLLPVGTAIWASMVFSALVMFGIGVVKSRWTKRNPVMSGIEIVGLAAIAGIAGYLFGSVLPGILGVAGAGTL